MPAPKIRKETEHCFLDEAGDTAFFGKGKIPIIGTKGVSLAFGLGMLKLNNPYEQVRQQIRSLAQEIEQDDFLNCIPSVRKKIGKGGFHFHATDDPPEVRERFFKFIRKLDCSLEMIVARKNPVHFARKHDGKEAELYADLLSHLIKDKLQRDQKLVLNIAHRGPTTKNATLERALEKGIERFLKKRDGEKVSSEVVFNVQRPVGEPLLCITDYLCWTVQRVFEKGETRFYDYMKEKIGLVVDLYDREKYEGWKNYYTSDNNPLTEANKLSPPTP